MKSTFHKTLKPLSDFEEASLISIGTDYLGLYVPAVIEKESVPFGWYLYYIQSGKTYIAIMNDIPARHCAGSLILEHPYELKGFFKREKLHSDEYAVIEPVDIVKFMMMPLPDGSLIDAPTGYTWDGMINLSVEGAKNLPKDVPLYELREDNTEVVVEDRSEIKDDGFYGVQKPNWYHHLYRTDDEETEEEN